MGKNGDFIYISPSEFTTLQEHAQIHPKTVYRALRTFPNPYQCKLEIHTCQPGAAQDIPHLTHSLRRIFLLRYFHYNHAVFLWRYQLQYSMLWQSVPSNI